MLREILVYVRNLSSRRKYLLMIGIYVLLTLVVRLLSFFSFYILGDASGFSIRQLALILGGITAVEIISQIVAYFFGLIESKVITQTSRELQNRILSHLLHARHNQVSQVTGAYIQTTLQEALPAYAEFASILSNFIILVPAGIVVMVLCFVLDWRLFILSIGLCVIEFVLSNKMHNVKARQRGVYMEALTSAMAVLLDGIHAVLSMRWMPSLNSQMIERYKKAVLESANAEKNEKITGTLITLLERGVSVAGEIGFLALGAWQITRGNTSLSVFLALYSVRTSLIDVFVLYTGLRGSYLEFKVNQARVMTLLNMQLEESSTTDERVMDWNSENAICLEHVSFAYDKGHPVLNNLSLYIKNGTCIRLSGRSGQGKTTIYSLLSGKLIPDQGEIYYFGVPISEMTEEKLHSLITYMSQRFYIFHGTIMENIRLGCSDASDEMVRDVARMAQLEEWVNSLPQGYNTVLHNNASSLSAGQRQRLMIARALIADHPIWLMDEITSSLDVQTARELERTLLPLLKQRTVLFSTHKEDGLICPNTTIALENAYEENSD